MMRFGYGDFRALDEDNFAFTGGSTRAIVGQGGRLERVAKTLEFEFCLVPPAGFTGNVQNYLTQRMLTISEAIKSWGKDVGLYTDSGAKSAIFITSSETATGVQVLEYPFPQADKPGADYASGLKGRVAFAAEYLPPMFLYPVFGGASQVVGYGESITVVNPTAGPRRKLQEFSSGYPAEYVTADHTIASVTQSGSITLEANQPMWGDANQPLWPDLLVNEATAIQSTQEKSGNIYTCTRSWNYAYEWTRPFSQW